MSTFSRKPWLRWMVPLLAAIAFVGGGGAIGLISATARDKLPDRTAAQLLVDVQRARVDALSGTITETADLGLPDLSGLGGNNSSELSSLVSGSHTLRVWYDGPQRLRLALLGSLGESDVIRNGSDVWAWSSNTRSAKHWTVPAKASGRHSMEPTPMALTPQQAADMALKAIGPSTRVSTDGSAVVAGRPAYELVLQPREAGSLVSSVRIAIDAQSHIPTRVQVFARGMSKPAFEVGFTSLDLTRPDPAIFAFEPPPGTTVTESKLPSPFGLWHHGAGGTGDHGSAWTGDHGSARTGDHGAPLHKNWSVHKDWGAGSTPTVVGSGWSSVVVAKVPASLVPSGQGAGGSSTLSGLMSALPRVSGSWGSGRLLQGTLFSVLLTDDGRLVAGAVSPDLLYQALAAQ